MARTSSHKNVVLAIAALMIGMFGLAFASVPLYNLFCRVTGFGGTTQTATAAPGEALDRTLSIRFDANTAKDLPWDFKPEQNEVTVRIGESKLIYYSATNRSDTAITGTSVFNVTPNKAGAFFNKTQCFCFEKQVIQPGEKIYFPVSFFVDPAMDKNKNLDDVGTITLSYTFFRSKQPVLKETHDERI